MGSNNGTGQPIHFMCAACRKRVGGIGNAVQGWRDAIVRTGRVRPLTKSQQGTGGARVLQQRHEYRCRWCRHVGWTRHADVLDRPVEAAA